LAIGNLADIKTNKVCQKMILPSKDSPMAESVAVTEDVIIEKDNLILDFNLSGKVNYKLSGVRGVTIANMYISSISKGYLPFGIVIRNYDYFSVYYVTADMVDTKGIVKSCNVVTLKIIPATLWTPA